MSNAMRESADILGVTVDNITMHEAVERTLSFLSGNKLHAIYTPNAEIIMSSYKDPDLKNILNQSDLLTADGAGVVLASGILGTPVKEKVSGIDLVKNVFDRIAGSKTGVFFLGGKPGVAETAKTNLHKIYPGLLIKGTCNGYFSKDDENAVIDMINASGADFLLVGLGAPKQEKWIHQHKNDLKVKVCIGVGGILDVFAGKVRLAPEFMRKSGLEWLYRLYREPWRFKRMLALPRFMLLVLAVRLGLMKISS